MNIDKVKKVYLIGIGGIGMSGLARYFQHLGYAVAGYDKTETELTKTLDGEGIAISYEDDVENIPSLFAEPNEETLIIFTPAVPKDLAIKNYFLYQPHP